MTRLVLLYALSGGLISSAIMMRVWLLDPPHGVANKFFGTLVAGVVGGIVGGLVMQGSLVSAPQDPIPCIVAAASFGTILSAITALSMTKRTA